ncbi:hypothetical protein [Amnibacterium setariae]|uniref:Uncharacterized protein n=1 Tax=Amnibacterium setariae TaxID=2306585 RepID=A0A3A1U0W9_9MICO|nr:hypothetical protein [Amnibacterium setariae]RIX29980.1 hypothetical protein D1781_00425 [Amnibacterium setariae]
MELTTYPTAALYALLALITAGVGVGIIVWQTGASRNALVARRSFLVGGVLLVLLGGVVLLTQIFAIVTASYGTLG